VTSSPDVTNLAIPGIVLLAEIGRGAQTTVYRGRHDGLDVAVKVAHRPCHEDPTVRLAFEREAAVLASAQHPGLPGVHALGEVGGRPYLAMDLVEGQPLTRLLSDAPIGQAGAIRIAVDVAGALWEAHRRGLVHHDVKPSNIIVDAAGRATIIDFGLAGRAGSHVDEPMAGTLLYSAPEQSGMLKRPVDARADLYSLGVVLFECVAGRPPFASDDAGELIRLHAVATPPSLTELASGVSDHFAAVVARLLAKDPDDRFASAAVLLTELEPLAVGPGFSEHDRVICAHETPLVGVDRHMSDLHNEWTRVRHGVVRVAAVVGGPGTGKSRLLGEFARSVRERGGLALTAQATARSLAPFSTVRAMLEEHVRRVAGLREPDRARAVAHTVEAFSGHPGLQDLASRISPSAPSTGAWDERPDARFGAAVVRALAELATSWTSAVVCLDDAERLDDASWQVLQDLVRHHAAAVLAVLATSAETGLALFERQVTPTSVRPVRLEALDERAIGLITRDLLGRAADADVCELIGRRAAGSPLAAVEYCRALIGTGALQPAWSSATIDLSRVEELPVSADVIDLLLGRLEQLGADARDVLVAAAVAGNEFDMRILGEVAQVSGDAAFDALAEALSLRLVEPAGAGRYRFLHARARQTLLARISDDERRRLHTRIARALDREPVDDANQLYGAAWHYACGDDEETLPRLVATGVAAARVALEDRNAPVAHRMMTAAAGAAARLGQELDADEEELFGLICARAGHGAEAQQHYERAVETCSDPVQRARVLIAIGHLDTAAVRYDSAAKRSEDALRLLGQRIPRRRTALAAKVLMSIVSALVHGLSWRFGRAKESDRERLELQMDAHSVASLGHSALHRDFSALAHMLMARVPANRLGVCPAYIRLHAGLAALGATLRFRRTARRGIANVQALARQIDDPLLESETAILCGFAYECLGEPTAAANTFRTLLGEQGEWLDSRVRDLATSSLVWNLSVRGHQEEAEVWLRRARRGASRGQAQWTGDLAWRENLMEYRLGRRPRRDDDLEALMEATRAAGDSPIYRSMYDLVATVCLDAGDLAGCQEALAEWHRHPVSPRRAVVWENGYFITQVAAILTEARRQVGDERAATMKRARTALRQLRSAGRHPITKGHLFALEAADAVLRGRSRRALRMASRAESVAYAIDSPEIRYLALVERARCLRDLGRLPEARREATLAMAVASEGGWSRRVRGLADDFDLVRGRSGGAGVTAVGTGSGVPGEHSSRRLDALLQVAVAAANVLEPSRLAATALDRIVEILGADRAFLFVANDGELDVYAARDSEGCDVAGATDYSSTLLHRAWFEERALVITGTEEGAVLGSQSAVLHGLRSILAAPVLLEGRALGVIYLDSRLAKGMFTDDDVGILTAIATQVAAALETARTAQLQVNFEAERRERALADTLRVFMTSATGELDPDQVLRQSLVAAADVLGFDAAYVVVPDRDACRIVGSAGRAAAATRTVPGDDELLGRVLLGESLHDGYSRRPPAGLALAGAERVGSWIAAPINVGGDVVGAIIIVSANPGAYGATQVGILETLVAHAAVAYKAATLFHEVRRLATTDALSGLDNRRHSLERAAERLRTSRDADLALAAVMIDIDHFKSVNDSYGHATGDDVINGVAERLALLSRDDDIVGRYGGEEFVIVMSATPATARSIAERLRVGIEATPIPTRSGPLPITVSVGVSHLVTDDREIGDVLGRADRALYRAKENGRNQVAADAALDAALDADADAVVDTSYGS
jgi:eukaryotic-like serine/threonine-protein kinase